ncbi:MAG TPA: sigma factor-like helix-turn-helix DNA-binding protein, partial [Steroidobacter sp.]|nr:sigma factor-like helix-turn-helix DNA-binding protein [Steroidobacter sp.]
QDDDALLSFLFARLNRPRAIDALSGNVFIRLQHRHTRIEPSLCFIWKMACSAFNDCFQAPPPRCALNGELRLLVESAVAQLPNVHACALIAHKREGLSYDALSEKLRLSASTIEKYVSQARALIRTFAVAPSEQHEGPIIIVSRDEILASEGAAGWFHQLSTAHAYAPSDFSRWLRQRALHVRELLLIIAWDRLFEHVYAARTLERQE